VAATAAAAQPPQPAYETAEEAKHKLQCEQEHIVQGALFSAPPPADAASQSMHKSTEEEKKRLEREER
jgi:hypothetical protein